jgi:K+-transporting ATPase c subunit
MSHRKTIVVVDLADKHNVAVSLFKDKPYFHIRHNHNGKSVSLGMADMESLIENYSTLKKRVKRLRKEEDDEKKQKKQKKQKNKKNKKRTVSDDESSSSSSNNDDDNESDD